MAKIPTHKQWLADTALNFKPRNSMLQALDQAILQFERSGNTADLWRVRNAFEDWKRSEGPSWQASDRNRKQSFTMLDRELSRAADPGSYRATHMTVPAVAALGYVARQRKLVLQGLFANKQVTLKAARLKDQLALAGEKVRTSCQHAGTWLSSNRRSTHPVSSPVRDKMIAMAASFFGVSGLEQLGTMGGLILDILAKCAVSVPPVVGQVKDGYDLFTGWTKVGAGLYAQHNLSERSYSIDTGVPSAAFSGLKRCLEEETRREAVSAANATASFAVKTGLAFVDGGAISGPVVGAVSALAEFAHILYLLGMEYRATQAINRALREGNLDVRLFKTYPLLGCYMLVSATLSDLIPIESFATPGWMDYIENLQKNAFAQIYNTAADLIDRSPWEIAGLPKRRAGTDCGILGEAHRAISAMSPLSALAGLQKLAS